MKTTYYNIRTKETTEAAADAMRWHKNGDTIEIWKKGKTTRINGAAQKPKGERNAAEENRQHCKHIAEETEAYAAGDVHRCPECSTEIHFPDNVGDKFKCPHCHEVNDVDDWEQLSIWDYMNDILDIDFIVSRDREYRSCKICVAWGGPNIFIDTASAYVKLYWWTEYAEYPLSYAARDAIDEWAEEYWNM